MPEIKQIPKIRVVFVTNKGPYHEATPRGFQRIFTWLGANNLHPVGRSLAIYHDEPGRVAEAEMRSESCVPVAESVNGSGDVGVKQVGGFHAATIEYRGAENIQRAYDELYGWLHIQGYRDDGSPMETFLSQPGEQLHAEIAIPIVRMEKTPVVPEKKPARARKASSKKSARKRSTKTKRATKKRSIKIQ